MPMGEKKMSPTCYCFLQEDAGDLIISVSGEGPREIFFQVSELGRASPVYFYLMDTVTHISQ